MTWLRGKGVLSLNAEQVVLAFIGKIVLASWDFTYPIFICQETTAIDSISFHTCLAWHCFYAGGSLVDCRVLH